METVFNQTGESLTMPGEIADLAEEFATRLAEVDELLAVASALAICPTVGEAIVVEIGTYLGRTACFMGRALQVLGRSLPVLSIDAFGLLDGAVPEEHNVRGDYDRYHRNVRKAGLERTCMVMTAQSHAAARLVPDRIGLLLIDGGHSYDTVRGDIDAYANKILPGGVMILDDYTPRFPGVARAADEFFNNTTEFTVLHKARNVVALRHVAGA